jgi:hypothetical protein
MNWVCQKAKENLNGGNEEVNGKEKTIDIRLKGSSNSRNRINQIIESLRLSNNYLIINTFFFDLYVIQFFK